MEKDNFVLRLVYILILIIPFFTVLLFIRKLDSLGFIAGFVFLFFIIFWLISVIVITIKYKNVEIRKNHKIKIILISIFTVIVFFTSYKFQLKISNFIYFKQNESLLNEFIIEHNKCKEITNVSKSEKYIDNSCSQNLQSILSKMNMSRFSLTDEKIYSFTINGFLDNCNGFSYSPNGFTPKSNGCGDIILWQYLGNNWYYWVTT